VESYASRLNGAQVNIRSLKLSFLAGECVMRGVEIAHHINPMRNLLEIGEIRLKFEFLPLLSLKLIIPELEIQTVRYKTKRTSSGILETDSEYASTAFLDRVAPISLSTVRGVQEDSRLRNLGQLSLGIGAKATVSQMWRELETQRRIRDTENELEKRLVAWEEAAAHLGTEARERSAQEKEGDLRRAENLAAKVSRETETLLNEVNAIRSSIPSDVLRVTKRIGLPHLDGEDFTQELLGKRTLNHLERLSYWVELSRRRMAWHPPDRKITLAPYFSAWGHEVHFRDANSLPRFWLKKATVSSTAGSDPNTGNIQGTLTNLTSDPAHSKPLRLDIEADFPGLSIFGAELHSRVDHTGAEPQEQFEFSIDSFLMNDWYLEQSPELKIGVAAATASLTFQADYRANLVSAQWNVELRNSEFNVASRYRQLQSTLREAFAPHTDSLTVSGSISGPQKELVFDVRSNIGKTLAQALGDKFTLSLRAAEETIHSELTDRFDDPIERLRRRVNAAGLQMQTRFTEVIAELKGRKG